MHTSVRFEGAHCTLAISRRTPEVVLITITGTDVGELGDAPFRELAEDLLGPTPVRLFIDARESLGASMNVSNDWALWLRKNKPRLSEVTMLTGSSFLRITADFVRRFAELDEVMRITTDPVAFDEALEAASL